MLHFYPHLQTAPALFSLALYSEKKILKQLAPKIAEYTGHAAQCLCVWPTCKPAVIVSQIVMAIDLLTLYYREHFLCVAK